MTLKLNQLAASVERTQENVARTAGEIETSLRHIAAGGTLDVDARTDVRQLVDALTEWKEATNRLLAAVGAQQQGPTNKDRVANMATAIKELKTRAAGIDAARAILKGDSFDSIAHAGEKP